MALAGGLLVVAVLSGLFIDAARPDTIEPDRWWHWALIVTPPALVAVRRSQPVAVLAVATAAQAAIWVSGLPEVLLPIVVLLFTGATEAGRAGLQAAIAAAGALTVVTAIGTVIADDVSLYQLPLVALTSGTAIWLGVNAARQRQLAGELAATVAETRLQAEHQRDQAVADERTEIARELHDIIGHTLAVIAVRAEAADRVAERQPEAAVGAVGAIATASRSALDETRRVLAGLRRSGPAELAPPPDLAAVSALVADLSAEGIDASLHQRGCDSDTPPAVVAGGAYRIVQESLTNAVKHGGAETRITVDLDCEPSKLTIRVVNTIEADADRWSTGPGSGVAAMAERAEVLGGRLTATAATTTADEGHPGRFTVWAELPIGGTTMEDQP